MQCKNKPWLLVLLVISLPSCVTTKQVPQEINHSIPKNHSNYQVINKPTLLAKDLPKALPKSFARNYITKNYKYIDNTKALNQLVKYKNQLNIEHGKEVTAQTMNFRRFTDIQDKINTLNKIQNTENSGMTSCYFGEKSIQAYAYKTLSSHNVDTIPELIPIGVLPVKYPFLNYKIEMDSETNIPKVHIYSLKLVGGYDNDEIIQLRKSLKDKANTRPLPKEEISHIQQKLYNAIQKNQKSKSESYYLKSFTDRSYEETKIKFINMAKQAGLPEVMIQQQLIVLKNTYKNNDRIKEVNSREKPKDLFRYALYCSIWLRSQKEQKKVETVFFSLSLSEETSEIDPNMTNLNSLNINIWE